MNWLSIPQANYNDQKRGEIWWKESVMLILNFHLPPSKHFSIWMVFLIFSPAEYYYRLAFYSVGTISRNVILYLRKFEQRALSNMSSWWKIFLKFDNCRFLINDICRFVHPSVKLSKYCPPHFTWISLQSSPIYEIA